MNLDTIKTNTTWNDAATSINANFIKLQQAIGNGVGGSGGNDKNYVHTQEQASKEWTIIHNLGKYPAVSVIDSAGTEVEGEVHYVDLNKVKLIFSAEFSGKATLN